MKADIREQLGKAAFDADEGRARARWGNQTEDIREAYRQEAEAVILALGALIVPQFTYIAAVLTDRTVEIKLSDEAMIAWPEKEE